MNKLQTQTAYCQWHSKLVSSATEDNHFLPTELENPFQDNNVFMSKDNNQLIILIMSVKVILPPVCVASYEKHQVFLQFQNKEGRTSVSKYMMFKSSRQLDQDKRY